MADETITIGDELMAKLDEYAEAAGQASGEEFVKVILQREIDKLEDAGANEKIEDRLRGLGYIG